MIAAFDRANLVALGERHWAREDSQFRLELIQNPAFAHKVNDIVIEFGNPLYQSLLDRFIDGEWVPAAELQHVWRDTTQPVAFDSPVYEQFLSTARAVNSKLPPPGRLRVLAADYPVNWSTIRTPADLSGAMRNRDRSAASIIRQEVLSKGRKALVVFGSAHIYRNRPGTIVDLLKEDSRAKWFIVVSAGGPGLPAAITASKGTPAAPALLGLATSALGRLDAADVFERGAKRIKVVEGKPVFIPVFEADTKAGDLADACLSFGSEPPEFVRPPRGLYDQTEYGGEVQRRRSLIKLVVPGK